MQTSNSGTARQLPSDFSLFKGNTTHLVFVIANKKPAKNLAGFLFVKIVL